MKKPLLFVFAVLSTGLYAQEHFSGINTSRRVGMLNASVNPAELVNLKENYEVNLFNFSVNFSNTKAPFAHFETESRAHDLDVGTHVKRVAFLKNDVFKIFIAATGKLTECSFVV